jgi:hypothetical protein
VRIEELERGLLGARVKDDLNEGSRIADRERVRFQTGRSETERLLNEARGIGGSFRNPESNLNVGFDLQLGARLSEIQLRFEERRLEVMRDIVQARQREADEASRALLFAEREDQVRAALLRRFGQNGGKQFSADRFSLFDSSTRNAISRFAPDLLPAAAQTDRQSLERELSILLTTTEELRALVEGGRNQAAGAQSGLSLPSPTGGPRPEPPQINLGPMSFSFGEEARELAEIFRSTVSAELRTEMSQIRASVQQLLNQATGATAAGIGAGVINSGD